jgi:hypothetical protein
MWTTGRRRAAVYTTIATPLVILSTWAALGMQGFGGYFSRLDDFSERYASHSVSLTSVLMHADVSLSVASLAVGILGALLLARAVRADEATSLLLVVAAGLVASPIVWFHYFGLLVVPIAIRSPSFSAVWLYFPGLWLAADLNIAGHLPAAAVFATVASAVLVVSAVRGRKASGESGAGSVLPRGAA